MAAALADVHDLGIGTGELQHIGVHQIVDQHHIGLRQGTSRLECHQFDVAGAGADQPGAGHRGVHGERHVVTSRSG